MKAGLLSQRRTSSTKKMLRCHLCLLPTRIITIFLHMEGTVASFEGVKKNAISTKYREASSGGAQLQSSGRILGSCHSLSYLGCASFLTTFTGFSVQKCLHSQKKTPPPSPTCSRCSVDVCGELGGGTGGASCAAQSSLTAPKRLRRCRSLLGCPRPERRLWSQSSSFPALGAPLQSSASPGHGCCAAG